MWASPIYLTFDFLLTRKQPAETMEEIADFCGQHNPHLICDEVFAMSVYGSPDISEAVQFKSALAFNFDDKINPQNIHVAYGMSKDFCATGFRLGVLSRNEGLITAVSTISQISWLLLFRVRVDITFSVLGWVPYIVQDIRADMLTNVEFRIEFMEKNRHLLAEHSAILTAFLREHDIPHYTRV